MANKKLTERMGFAGVGVIVSGRSLWRTLIDMDCFIGTSVDERRRFSVAEGASISPLKPCQRSTGFIHQKSACCLISIVVYRLQLRYQTRLAIWYKRTVCVLSNLKVAMEYE